MHLKACMLQENTHLVGMSRPLAAILLDAKVGKNFKTQAEKPQTLLR